MMFGQEESRHPADVVLPMDMDDDDDTAARPSIRTSATQAGLLGEMSSSGNSDDDVGDTGIQIGASLHAMEEEEEEEDEEDEEDDDDEGEDKDEEDEDDDDDGTFDLLTMSEMPEDVAEYNVETKRAEAWQDLILPRFRALNYMCSATGKYATHRGGHSIIAFAEEPCRFGFDGGTSNLFALVRSCPLTNKPRYHAVARAFQISVAERRRPGSITEEDVKNVNADYSRRPPNSIDTMPSKTARKKFGGIVRTLAKLMIRFKIPFSMITVMNMNQNKCFCYGYSATYPVINFLTACAACQNMQSVTDHMAEMRRSAPGHSEHDYDELGELITQLYRPEV